MFKVKFLLMLCLAVFVTFTATVQASDLSEKYKLEKVLILSRHNIRAPLVEKNSVLAEITPHKWFEWQEAAGELSLRGGLEETSMGQYFRQYLENEGFMTDNYIPREGEMRFYANSFQRTIATAQYFASGMLPVANVKVEHKFDLGETDPVFLPSLSELVQEVGEDTRRQIDDEVNNLGSKEILAERLGSYAETTAKVLDFNDSEYAKNHGIDKFITDDFDINAVQFVKGTLHLAMLASDALLMQYYEENDPVKAAFGHNLTENDWKTLADVGYFGVNVIYEWPTLATGQAYPLLQVMRDELTDNNRRFTFLCGHDVNIAMVLSALGVENYNLSDSLEKKTPVGVKIVIEKRIGRDGQEYAAVNLVYQNTQQMKNVDPLTLENPPQFFPLKFKGLQTNEDGLYLYSDFEQHLNNVIAKYNSFFCRLK